MNRIHLYLLALALILLGVGIFLYKALYLGLPLTPSREVQVWNIETRISFTAEGGPVKISLLLPVGTADYAVSNEHFISTGYGLVVLPEGDNRRAVWSIREAKGNQNVYYQAVVRKLRVGPPRRVADRPEATARYLRGPTLEAASSVISAIKAKSADTASMVSELFALMNTVPLNHSISLLVGNNPPMRRKVRVAANILEQAGVPARPVQGVQVSDEMQEFSRKVQLVHWLEFYDGKTWQSFDPATGRSPVPKDWLVWWRGPSQIVEIQGAGQLKVTSTMAPKLEEGIKSALSAAKIKEPLLMKFSLFSLPVTTQNVYRVVLLIPVGAFLLVILRNIVGIKTFGTFMPVLIALAFRDTGLIWGIFFFTVVTLAGFGIRYYLDQLRLLLVPRLASVLIVVLGLMVGLSVLTHNVGIHLGISVALFPMVILTMTIERMCILWEERGAAEALITGLGSFVAAGLAFALMNIKELEHLVFVFPELLFVLLAATILLGRYSGYRLTELLRFKALAMR